MGIDMYLYKKHYVKNWDFMTDSEKHSVVVTKERGTLLPCIVVDIIFGE